MSDDERRRLAECCAYFKALQFRPAAGPTEIRKVDKQVAQEEIEAVLRACGHGEAKTGPPAAA